MAGLYKELFDKIFRESLDVVAIVDPASGNVIRINNAVRYSLGYGIEDLVGKNLSVLFSKESSPKIQNWLEETKNHGPVFTEENLIRADGSTYPMKLTTTLTPWDEGDAILVTFRDVVGERRNEEVLRRSEHLLENSFELITILGPDGAYRYASPSYKQISGYEPEELSDQDFFRFIHTEDVSRLCASLDSLQADHGVNHTAEFRFKRKDGLWAYLESRMKTLPGESEEAITIIIARDLTELKQAEKAFLENLTQLSKKNRYETIINSVTQSVHQSINLQEVLENAADSMSRNIQGADFVAIYLVEGATQSTGVNQAPDSPQAVLKAYRGYPDWFIERVRRIPYPKDFTWKTIISGALRYCADAETDTVIGPAGREVGTKSYVSMPIRLKNEVIGVININSLEKNSFDEEELKLVEGVARQIEVAIKNAQQAEELRQSEERYHTLFDQSPVGVYIFDRDFTITHCNKKMVQILQSSYDRIIGTDMRRLCDHRVQAVLDTVLAGESVTYEGSYVGTTTPAKLWVSKRLSPLRDSKGKVIGGMAVVEDITERKRAEEELLKSQAKYADLFENANDMIFTFDLSGNLTSANRVAFTTLGYDLEDVSKSNLSEILTPEGFRFALDMLQNAIIRKSDLTELQPWELEAVKKDGSKLSLEVRTRLIWEGEKIVGVQGIARDVTERKKMQEEIVKAQKLESLGILAGGIAHDFNNLLTSILGNISLAKMYANPNDKGYKRLSEAEKACIRTRDLTQQLLTFSRGGAPVKRVVSSLGEIIKDSASFAVSGSKVKCEFVIEEKLWPVEVDQGQISQVMNNLVINADQAMPKGGVIKIKVENAVLEKDETPHLMPGRYVKITIEDSGVGIPEELLTRIFDPYFTTKQRGSGLGLATVYSIIKNHDGYVGVESRLGVGTRFKVYIPAKEGGASTESEAQESLKRGKGRVLVVDDVDIVRETAGEILSHLGYEVDYAKNGNEVIEKYARSRENGKPIDTVIIDLNIPGEIGGQEAIQKLLDKYPGVKAIVSTGYSNDPILSDYGKYGFRGVISKPYKIEELGDIVYEVINGN
ncbi:MAG TPA: PAS domain S-box protein [Thermodesulfobacteriota bacterium]|nr:PAS domain S-box protein [Thermodesulfobacteriota bacterium]